MTAKPENRSEAIAEMLAAAGGRLIGWYLTLGRYDWLIVAEAPDERTLVAAVLAAAAGGSLSDITTTVALSAEDTVKAFGQAGELAKKFRSDGADYYGVPVESAGEFATELKKRTCARRVSSVKIMELKGENTRSRSLSRNRRSDKQSGATHRRNGFQSSSTG
jgi:uncharacterized protein with GYD domain